MFTFPIMFFIFSLVIVLPFLIQSINDDDRAETIFVLILVMLPSTVFLIADLSI